MSKDVAATRSRIWNMDEERALMALANHILAQDNGGNTGFSSEHARRILDMMVKLQNQPALSAEGATP